MTKVATRTIGPRPFDSFAKPRMRICVFDLETFRVKHRVETMGVAGIYWKSAKVPRKASASEAPEHRTAPSLRCVGLKLSKGLFRVRASMTAIRSEAQIRPVLYLVLFFFNHCFSLSSNFVTLAF